MSEALHPQTTSPIPVHGKVPWEEPDRFPCLTFSYAFHPIAGICPISPISVESLGMRSHPSGSPRALVLAVCCRHRIRWSCRGRQTTVLCGKANATVLKQTLLFN